MKAYHLGKLLLKPFRWMNQNQDLRIANSTPRMAFLL